MAKKKVSNDEVVTLVLAVIERELDPAPSLQRLAILNAIGREVGWLHSKCKEDMEFYNGPDAA